MFERFKIRIDVYSLLRILCAILIAFTCTIIMILCFSDVPLLAMQKFFFGAFTTKRNFFNIIEKMIPLVFAGLSLNVIQKAGLANLVADGALYIGAVIAAVVAISLKLPKGIHTGTAILISGIVGGVITLIPAILKKITGVWEMVVAIMLNTVFFYVGQFIINNGFLDEVAGYASYKFNPTAKLGNMIKGTQTHFGLIIMIIAYILVVILMDKTRFGYQLKVVGSNIKYAKNSGINVFAVIMISQFIGGFLAGAGGAVEMLGMYDRFLWSTPVSFVWDAVLLDILAGANAKFIPVAAFFFAYVRVGAGIMSRGTDLDQEIVAIIQAIIIFLVSAERFMYNFKKKREAKQALAEKEKALQVEAANIQN